MTDTIDFVSIFAELGFDTTNHGGNLRCPFCGKPSFKAYPDRRAHCHSCEWHGDAVQLFAKANNVSRQEAYTELAELYGLGKIRVLEKTEKTYQQTLTGLSNDLEFLARCRMYFGFYADIRQNKAYYQKKSGMSAAVFSKVINGHFDQVSPKTWNMIVLMLRKSLNLKSFKTDSALGPGYWKQHIADNRLSESVNRFR